MPRKTDDTAEIKSDAVNTEPENAVNTEPENAANTEVKTESEVEKSKKSVIYVSSDPLIKGTEHEQKYVAVNGKSVMVKTDENVEMDDMYVEVLKRTEQFRKSAAKYAESQNATV